MVVAVIRHGIQHTETIYPLAEFKITQFSGETQDKKHLFSSILPEISQVSFQPLLSSNFTKYRKYNK